MRLKIACLPICVLCMPEAMASDQPARWEAGVGVAAMILPAYRGSDTMHRQVLPVPYLRYEGDFIKADRHGVRGELFDSKRLEMNLSASASPPGKSSDVVARIGMPDLQPMVELGIQADITLWEGGGKVPFIKLRLPVREALTLTSPWRNAGTVFTPNLNADLHDAGGMPGWTLGLVAGPILASRRQNTYFYSVASEYATASRPAYDARGGYGGSQWLMSLSRKFTNSWVGAFVRYDTLKGAVFADSPLVRQDHYASAGLAICWIIGRSGRFSDPQQ